MMKSFFTNKPTKLLLHIFFIFFLSCSSAPKEKEKKVACDQWKNHSTDELKDHPYFRQLPLRKIKHDSGLETWIYQDQARFHSKAYCDSLGGCIGLPSYSCENAFSVKDGTILGMEQTGSCPGLDTIKTR